MDVVKPINIAYFDSKTSDMRSDEQTLIQQYLHKSTIYEVNLRQYTPEGTLEAFIQHLPRLHAMGVDVLWFMPLHPIGITNRKGSLGSYYSIRDYTDINPEFGTRDEFKSLVNKAHALGMKVIIDWVANHAAWDNTWTKEHPEYFKRYTDGSFISPYDWTDVIQVDHENEAAHQALREAMCYWVREMDIDGFRADLAHLTPLHFWIKARYQCEEIKSNLIWLAETEEPSYFQAFDVVYAWKWMHRTEKMIKEKWSVQSMIEVLHEQKHAYPKNALELFFTTNHDENSWNGTEMEKYGIYASALSAFSFVYPWSVPLIYSGQEIPNEKRLQFFDKDPLSGFEQLKKEAFYTALTHFRKKRKCSQAVHFIHTGDKVLNMLCGDEREIWYVANFNDEAVTLEIEHIPVESPFEDIMNGVIQHEKQPILLHPGMFRLYYKSKLA